MHAFYNVNPWQFRKRLHNANIRYVIRVFTSSIQGLWTVSPSVSNIIIPFISSQMWWSHSSGRSPSGAMAIAHHSKVCRHLSTVIIYPTTTCTQKRYTISSTNPAKSTPGLSPWILFTGAFRLVIVIVYDSNCQLKPSPNFTGPLGSTLTCSSLSDRTSVDCSILRCYGHVNVAKPRQPFFSSLFSAQSLISLWLLCSALCVGGSCRNKCLRGTSPLYSGASHSSLPSRSDFRTHNDTVCAATSSGRLDTSTASSPNSSANSFAWRFSSLISHCSKRRVMTAMTSCREFTLTSSLSLSCDGIAYWSAMSTVIFVSHRFCCNVSNVTSDNSVADLGVCVPEWWVVRTLHSLYLTCGDRWRNSDDAYWQLLLTNN